MACDIQGCKEPACYTPRVIVPVRSVADPLEIELPISICAVHRQLLQPDQIVTSTLIARVEKESRSAGQPAQLLWGQSRVTWTLLQ